jgi:exodeoxyribonuclease VII large subunit
MSNLFPATPTAAPERVIYSVTRLNREVKEVLEGSFPLVWVQGEISNLARPGSGHLYFSLKDAQAQVRCAMFKGRNRFLRFAPENGMEVLARAAVSLYEGRGEFQLIVEHMEPAGEGALQRAFEELKRRLHQEGLFDEAHKKPLPAYPRSIGVITSPTGAAVRDILNVLRRRWPVANVIIYPAPVQGAGASAKLAEALGIAAARKECEVLILARGGGSLEDLWAFNEEVLARAIFACPLPVVSGVGHEIDFTIADFVADRRAPTPSAAAELVSPSAADIAQRVGALSLKLGQCARRCLKEREAHLGHLQKRLPAARRLVQSYQQRVDELAMRLVKDMQRLLAARRHALLEAAGKLNRHNPAHIVRLSNDRCRWLHQRLERAARQYLRAQTARLDAVEKQLRTVSPQATLERGYAVVTDSSGRAVRDAGKLKKGEAIRARFARGSAEAQVTGVHKDKGT